MGSEVDPGQFLSQDELRQSTPTFQAYQHIMKCKQLGIHLDASQFSIEEIDLVYTFYDKITEIQNKKGKANGK